ncbi:MAG: hypothetical protein ACREOS_06255 [Candidatus Dormibacteraceae bacterium]
MKQLGKQKPRYKFFLNPYRDVRCTRCPKCEGKTRLRKLPLLIHIEPKHFMALNKTCRYCPYCDLLIAHRDEIEAHLAAFFAQNSPDVIGNDFLVVGTLDRPDWKKGVDSSLSVQDMFECLHDFKKELAFEVTGGWQLDESKTRSNRGKS